MKRFLLSLASAALLCGSASAADLLYDLKFGSDYNVDNCYYPNNNVYTSDFPYKLTESETFTISNFNNNNNSSSWTNYIKCGRKTEESTGYVTTDFMVPSQLTSVELTIQNWTASKVNAIELQSSSDKAEWQTIDSYAPTNDDSTPKTLTLTAPAPTANLYYRIAFDCAAGSNGLVWLSEVKYFGEPAGADTKKPAGIAFESSKVYTTATKAIQSPVLVNPNDVAVTYTSSNPEIVEVAADGTITAKAAGSAVITASSEENAEFLAGNASCTVVVATEVYSYADMTAASQNSGDMVYVNFAYTVTYVNGAYIYAADIFDNPVLFYNSGTSYQPGNILKTGYFAEYSPYNKLPEWKITGDLPEALEGGRLYPATYKSVSESNVNEVFYLAEVTFTEATPTAKSKNFTGILADGTELAFRTQWAVETSVEPGTYTVYGALGRYNSTLQFFPISYKEYEADPELPETLDVTADNAKTFSYDFTPASESAPFGDLVATATTTEESLTFTIAIPEGWTGIIHYPAGGASIDPLRRAPAVPYEWVPEEEMAAQGYMSGNAITVPADNDEYTGSFLLTKAGMACTSVPFLYSFTVTPTNPTAVDTITAADGEAVYYTLTGIKVENPANGVFVKVAGGKATKVVL